MKFTFYTNDARESRVLDTAESVNCHDWLTGDDFEAALANADCLLSIAEKCGLQMSSKIFSYISYGKPITHIYYSDQDVNVPFLKRYPLALCIKADKAQVERNANLLTLWLSWAVGKSVSWGAVSAIYQELVPGYVAKQVIDGCSPSKGGEML